MILSNGVFSNESIDNIKYFEIKKIKKIDLSSNNLKSLSLLNKVNWPEINTIFLNSNSLESIKELIILENLELIEVKNNPIFDIKEAEEIANNKFSIKIFLNIISKNINDNNNNININDRFIENNSNVNSEGWSKSFDNFH